MIRIPIELREYVELEEGKLEIVKPVPQDPTDLAEYRR